MGYEDSRIDFPCPECNQKFQVSLYQLIHGEIFACPMCGATSCDSELSEINQAFKELERELMNLRNGLNNGRFSWSN